MERGEIMKALRAMSDADLERLDSRVARTRRRAAQIRTYNEFMNSGEQAVLEEAIEWVQANPDTSVTEPAPVPVDDKGKPVTPAVAEPATPATPAKK